MTENSEYDSQVQAIEDSLRDFEQREGANGNDFCWSDAVDAAQRIKDAKAAQKVGLCRLPGPLQFFNRAKGQLTDGTFHMVVEADEHIVDVGCPPGQRVFPNLFSYLKSGFIKMLWWNK